MELFLLQYNSMLSVIGVNIVLGLSLYVCLKAGAFSIGQAGIAGVTAYSTALLTIRNELSIYAALALGIALGAGVSLLVNLPALRLRGVYLAIATLSFSEITRSVALNLDITGGALGLKNIPATATLTVIYGVTLVACVGIALMDNSRFGRTLEAMRLDEDAAAALGIDVTRQLLKVFTLSGALAGAAGVLYAHSSFVITPSNFSFTYAVLILTIVIVGGTAHWAGTVCAAIVFSALPTVMAATALGAGWPQLLLQGLLTLIVVFFYPVGIAAVFVPLRRRLQRKNIGEPGQGLVLREPNGGSSETLIEASSLSRVFGGVRAVSNVDLSVGSAEVVGLIGPNGAGKTTLVNLLSGADQPSGGTVRTRDLNGRRSLTSSARAGVTRTFQHSRVFDDMTLIENVEIGLYLFDSSSIWGRLARPRYEFHLDRLRRRTALALLERVGLSELEHRRAGDLSYGQKRRLEIARALGTGPRLLMLDEPAAGMNRVEKDDVAQLIGEVADRGCGVLLIEHDLQLVREAADRVALLNFGELSLVGDTTTVLEAPETIEAYIGEKSQKRGPRDRDRERMSGSLDLAIEDLGAGYGQAEVLRHISLDAPAGATVAVLGSNGAGKTTLLKSIAGIVRPRAGSIRSKGTDHTNWPAHKKVDELGICLVPETRAIVPKLTVRENLLLGARTKTTTEARQKLEEVHQLFPILADRSEVYGDSLSGGEQQMLAIGRALMSSPQALLLDEPSTGLAPKIVQSVADSIDQISQSGTTVVWVEQNISDALGLSDTAYVLELGEIVMSGASEELAADPGLISAYLSDGKEEAKEGDVRGSHVP